jgi:hypothetical protein
VYVGGDLSSKSCRDVVGGVAATGLEGFPAPYGKVEPADLAESVFAAVKRYRIPIFMSAGCGILPAPALFPVEAVGRPVSGDIRLLPLEPMATQPIASRAVP